MSSGSPNYNFNRVSPNSENPEVAVNGVVDQIDATLKGFDLRLEGIEEGGGSFVVPLGGTTGQVLMKLSNEDGDYDWRDPPVGSDGGAVAAKYKRYRFLMKAGSVNGGYAYAMSGMSFLDSKGDPISTSGASFDALGFTGSNGPARLFDSNPQTWWEHSPGGGIDQNVDTWVSVVFPAAVDIRSVQFTSRADPDAQNASAVTGKQVPRSVDYQYATDDAPATWITAQNIGGGNAVANYGLGETRTFAVSALP